MRDIDNKLTTGSICNLRLVSLNRKRITAIPISDGLAEDMSSAFRAVFKWTSRRHERIFFFHTLFKELYISEPYDELEGLRQNPLPTGLACIFKIPPPPPRSSLSRNIPESHHTYILYL